jgi:hypothetical protein
VAFIYDDEVELLNGHFLVIDNGQGFFAIQLLFYPSTLVRVFILCTFVQFLAFQDGIQPLYGADAHLAIGGNVAGTQSLHIVKLGELSD